MQNICTVLHCRRSRCMPLNGKGIGIIKLLFYFRGRSIQVSIGVELYCEISRRCFCTESALLSVTCFIFCCLFSVHTLLFFFLVFPSTTRVSLFLGCLFSVSSLVTCVPPFLVFPQPLAYHFFVLFPFPVSLQLFA